MNVKAVSILFIVATVLLAGLLFAPTWHGWGEAGAARLVEKGNHYFNVGGEGEYDLVRAEAAYLRAIELDLNVPDAWHQLARISFLRGDFDEGMVRINKQLELHGDGLMASYYIRGLIAGFQKNYERAEEDFKTFLEWDPRNWAAHNDLAWLYFEQGKFEDMKGIAQRGLAFDPINPWLLTMYGTALLNLGENERARIVLKEALARTKTLTPDDWARAYPGNDPRVAIQGLEQMLKAIEHNLALVNN